MNIIKKQNYNQSIKINKQNILCYDKKKLDEVYKNSKYTIVGETFEKNKKEKIDTVIISGKELNVSKYGKNSKIIYKRKGYFIVGKDKVLVILQNRLPFIIILLLLLLIGLKVGIWGYNNYKNTPSVAPEYPLPPEDDKSSDIKNDTSENNYTAHKNHASIKVAREIIINLDKKEANFIYQNFNASNKDAVVTICILKGNDEYAIARSGLVKSGKEIRTVNLLEDSIKLSSGVYNGRIKIDFYDEKTGEKAATSTDFDDVEITVK